MGSAKKFWEKINYIMPNYNKSNNFKLIYQTANDIISDEATAVFINKYFTDIGPKLAEKIATRESVHRVHTVPRAFMSEIIVTEDDVLHCVRDIDNRPLLTTFPLGY